MPTPPSGTVTFLFTDIEGSTRLAQQFPTAWPGAQARHHAIVKGAIEAHNGYVFQIIGDAFCAAFRTAPDALAAALDAQRALRTEPWGDAVIRVRMGLHTGSATALPDGDYDGYLTLVRVQRIMSGAYGGQVLMSQDVADLVGRDLLTGIALHDLGTHRLKDLATLEHLYQIVAPGLPADFPPLKTADHPNNLPTQLTSFIGREAEVAEVRRLLAGTRLLTLSGAGGVGKTRLALQIAAELVGADSVGVRSPRSDADGVWFVELAPLADPALIPNTIAAAVGVREEPNRPMLATLGDHFRAKTALVVLDNCEHLIADAAQVCDTLLHVAPHVKIIATSREALGIAGEHAYRVPSLGLPAEMMTHDALSHVASVQLFIERAQAAKSDFALSPVNAPAVAQICRRLDGIPLAIELAAARARSMTVEQIASHLDDRFRILTGGSRTALPRQQTLRATIDWSYRLLAEQEKTLLRRLSVFAGGWTLEAAESVCSSQISDVSRQTETSPDSTTLTTDYWLLKSADVLDLLSRLVDRSLVTLEESGDEPRYRMLETIRQFAQEALDQTGEIVRIRERHLLYFVGAAEGSGAVPLVRGGAARYLWLGTELDNLRAALSWAVSDNVEAGMRLLGAIEMSWVLMGRGAEGYSWAMKLLARETAAQTASRAAVLRLAGQWLSGYLGRTNEALPLTQEGIAICRSMGYKAELTRSLTLASAVFRESNLALARAALDEAEQLATDLQNLRLKAGAINMRGEYWRFLREDALAQPCFEQSLQIYRSFRADVLVASISGNLGFAVLNQGEHARARDLFREAPIVAGKAGATLVTLHQLAGLSSVAAVREQTVASARLFGAATAIMERQAQSFEKHDAADFERYLALARSQSEPAAFEAAFTEGYAMPLDEAIAYALEVSRE